MQHQDVFVDFHGWYESDHSVYLAMEYFDHGDLGKFIRQGLTERDAQVIGKQLLEGLVILHDQKWAHRDLKPQNIFVVSASPNWWVKIGDFGISKRLREGETGTNIGTPFYVAPEVLGSLQSERGSDLDSESESEEHKYKSSVAVDMWSLGCVLYQIPTKALPFPADKDLKRYCWKKRPFPQNVLHHHKVSQEGCDFVQKLLRAQPLERLTARAALQEPWISTADDFNVGNGMERAQSRKTKPQSEPFVEPEALQASASPSTNKTAVMAPIASARSSSNDTTAKVRSLRLDEQPGIERHERTSPRQMSALNGGIQRRPKSLSRQDQTALLRSERSHSPVRKLDRSPPRTVSFSKRDHDPSIGIALWPFAVAVKDEPNDLALKQFDIVYNIKKRDEDWWHGMNDSEETGVFPSNYIGQTRLQAEALFDFAKEDSADIDLKKGERITNISIFSPGWWPGTNSSGKRGHFPGNYVNLDLDAIKSDLNLERGISNGHSRHGSSPPGPNPRHDSTSHAQPPKPAGSRWIVARALKDYKAHDGSIAFEHGELITDIEELPSYEYLLGTSSSNQRGKFPHNLVDRAAETTNGPRGWTYEDRWLAHNRIPLSDAPRTGLRAFAKEAHQSSDPEELSFEVGDELVDIERSTLTWWFGWHHSSQSRGVFPRHMIVLKSDDDEQSDDDRMGGAEATVRPVQSTTSRRQGLFGRLTGRQT